MVLSSVRLERGSALSRVPVSLVLILVSSCAPAVAPRVPVAPAEIPVLEAKLASDKSDTDTRLRLADAQRRNGHADAAVALLQPVVKTEPAAAYFLALVREDQGQYAEARRLYQDYLERGVDAGVRRQVRDRLELLSRLELQQAARTALARERELAAVPPAPGVIGVFPFLVVATDPQLQPLGTALAELLTTDLAQTTRLRVVERAQVQALLQEIKLAESARVDPATAARGGHLMGAGRIVQGRVEGGSGALELQAAVLRVPGDSGAVNPLSERDILTRVFDVEKRLALGIYDRLGIQLTAAERQRVLHLATRNLQALLEFGLGLEAQDAGRYQEAAQHFARAVRLDPAFTQAAERAETAEAQARAATLSPVLLGQLGFIEFDALRRAEDFRVLEEFVPDPGRRDPAAEVLGAEGSSRSGAVQIIIRRPGGAQ